MWRAARLICATLFILIHTSDVGGMEYPPDFEEAVNGYGNKWMFFPDGDGVPHKISLDVPTLSMIRRADSTGDVEYRLYTRLNQAEYIVLDQSGDPDDNSSKTAAILEKLSHVAVKFVTHGWEASADQTACINIKNAYLNNDDVAVIAVDWSEQAKYIMYPVVAYQTKGVGDQVGKFLDVLQDRYNVTGDRVHLIGHSLGAHVMGNAGFASKMRVDRITGLDPARPMFEFPKRQDDGRLDPTDAGFVDVIHTCAGILGFQETIGHADFYPNHGVAPQPGCMESLWGQGLMEACSHSRSHFYFAESIGSPAAFPACRGADQSEECQESFMGESANRRVHGRFYLSTNHATPYGRGASRH